MENCKVAVYLRSIIMYFVHVWYVLVVTVKWTLLLVFVIIACL